MFSWLSCYMCKEAFCWLPLPDWGSVQKMYYLFLFAAANVTFPFILNLDGSNCQ